MRGDRDSTRHCVESQTTSCQCLSVKLVVMFYGHTLPRVVKEADTSISCFEPGRGGRGVERDVV